MIVGFASGIGYAASPGVTQVTLLSTSTANDRVQQFYLTFNRIDLLSQSGRTVPLISKPLYAEFMHVNGSAEVLATARIPQDLYIGISVSVGYSEFTCNMLDSTGGLHSSTFANGHVPASHVTVVFRSPILAGSSSLLLYFTLDVSKSARYPSSIQSSENFSIHPTLEVTAAELSQKPATFFDGMLLAQEGMVSALDNGDRGFHVTAADGPNCPAKLQASCADPARGPRWHVVVDEHTAIQGLKGISALLPGMAVDIDAKIQPDGSLLATRIGVYDANPAHLSVSWGLLGSIAASEPVLAAFETEALGFLDHLSGFPYFSFGRAEFKVSGQFTHLRDLPFPAAFTASNMVPGQSVFITSHAMKILDPPIYEPARIVTLMPQVLNGRILSMGRSGGFDTYTIQLASYNLFPALAHQPGQTTLLKTPGRVVVYVGDSTEMLKSESLHIGSVFRFGGLVFNDRGTLRMDCSQILDGVKE
ncbi:MAG TPA: DUF5666 domain-containing protein [Terracidiphilus sp.]|nr:DUF5666 domain-containing protein [Terracidiphilus sp.]